jgi:hypothetical protein
MKFKGLRNISSFLKNPRRIKGEGSASTERGQSLVELAVSIVLLLVVLAGMVDLGRMFFYYIGMRDAAQEGSVYGIVNPTYCAQIAERARNILSDPTGVQIDVRIDGVSCAAATANQACAGREIRVTVIDPDFPITMPFLGSILGHQSVNLKASVSGTILRPVCSAY